MSAKYLSEEKKNELFYLWENTPLTKTAIAKRLGMAPQTVSRYLRRAKLI